MFYVLLMAIGLVGAPRQVIFTREDLSIVWNVLAGNIN
jgi:hypothetical protein